MATATDHEEMSTRASEDKLKTIDVTGRRIRKDDIVRIIGVPPMTEEERCSDIRTGFVFDPLVGKDKRVQGCGRYGHVELMFRIPGDPPHDIQTVRIEPNLLRVRRTRAAGSRPRGRGC